MYTTLINEKISHVYRKGVAAKILQGMDRIRNEFDEVQARRWPTELLQNARDLAYDNLPVRVQISLTDDAVSFRHSGKPFSVQDILSIIHQVSSKKPGEGVGPFGTGFMSTFQLSMQVEVSSYLKDGDEPYKPFHICMDRSGLAAADISAAIEQAMESLKAADLAPDRTAFDRSAFNTEFRYHLNNGRSRRIAQSGVDDLRDTLAYILLFSPRLDSAELLIHTSPCQEDISVRRGRGEQLANGLFRQEILSGGETRTFFIIQREQITLAAEWHPENGFLPVKPGAPRLYVDFPLTGSDCFPFPVVLNSLALRPNEPRSGISLVEQAESLDARENRARMDRAAALYHDFFSALLEFDRRGIENLIVIPAQEENREWSAPWVRKHIYEHLYGFLAAQPLLPSNDGLHNLEEKGVRLVQEELPNLRERLAALWRQVQGVFVPEGGTDWYSVFANYGLPEEKTVTVRSALDAAANVIAAGLREGCGPVKWLASLYDLSMEPEQTRTAVRAGDAAIFHSQRPEDLAQGRLYTAREIFTDPGISERLKDAAQHLDLLEENGCLEIRKKLLHLDFQPETPPSLPAFSVPDFQDYIITRSDRKFRVRGYASFSGLYNAAWEEAWSLLLSTGPDEELYALCRGGWRELPDYEVKKGKPDLFDSRMWNNAYRGVLRQMLDSVKNAGTLEKWESHLKKQDSKADVIAWLERLYVKTAQYLRVSDEYFSSILPNQYGTFCAPSDLKMDAVGDEELKNISTGFKGIIPACDVRSSLLDQRLKVPNWNLPAMEPGAVAANINAALQQVLRTSLSQSPLELQEACTQLLGWIQEHPKEAERRFPAFCKEEDQMKLLTPRAAVSLRKKADRFSELLALAGTDDPEELTKILLKKMQSENPPQIIGPAGYDPDSGLYFDGGWDGLDETERGERLRRIGEGGERCAFRAIADYFAGQGYHMEREDGLCIEMADGNGGHVTILRPDTAERRQPGWDIAVKTEAHGAAREYFMEVKTHTPGSRVRSRLPMSDAQMRQAAGLGDRYILLLVIYDETADAALELRPFRNVIAYMAEGGLYSAEGGYMLAYKAA